MIKTNHRHILSLIIITIIVSLIVYSCKKTTPTTVEAATTVTGKVTDKVTGLGLVNIPVMIQECTSICCGPNISCKFFDTVITDLKGNYEISFTADTNTSNSNFNYSVVSSGDSVYYNDTSNYINIITGKTNEINFPLSHVKILQVGLKILNTSQNSFDFHSSTTKSNYFSNYFIIQNRPNILAFDTTLYLNALALSNYTFFEESCNYSSGKYTNCNFSLDTVFFIQNIDTTKVNFIIN
jgi:hypothetical protein